MKRYILIHYGEIGLKKANAPYFVEKLRKRVEIKLEQKFKETFAVRYTLGRLMVEFSKGFSVDKNEQKCVEVLEKVFGIKNFKFVYVGDIDIKKIGGQIWKNLPKGILDLKTKPETFCVRAKRSMKLSFTSVEAEREIGAILLENGIDIKVKMKDPELTVDVEFFNNHGYFSYKKYQGAGGLSANTQGKLVVLMSSGIDSPVAAYLMMKRGARIIFVSFHGYPYTDKSEMQQVKKLVEILSDYQFDTELWLIEFGQIQKAIKEDRDIPGKVRTLLYRRMMLRITEKISRRKKAKGLVTGDNFGQVASQTSDNLFAIHEASTIPLFQPLIGYDKEDIIKIAEKIGTFEISKLPCQESCVTFAPKHPELRADFHDLQNYEKNLPIQEWIEKVLNEAEIINY